MVVIIRWANSHFFHIEIYDIDALAIVNIGSLHLPQRSINEEKKNADWYCNYMPEENRNDVCFCRFIYFFINDTFLESRMAKKNTWNWRKWILFATFIRFPNEYMKIRQLLQFTSLPSFIFSLQKSLPAEWRRWFKWFSTCWHHSGSIDFAVC